MFISENELRKAIRIFLSSEGILSEAITTDIGHSSTARDSLVKDAEGGDTIEGLADPGSFSGVSAEGLALIMKEEGFRSFVYDDLNSKVPLSSYESSKGTPTIGVGHAIQSGTDRARFRKYLKGGSRMSKEEGRQLLMQDVPKYQLFKRQIKVPITQNMFDALTSFSFNTGAGGPKKYGVINALNSQGYKAAAEKIRNGPQRAKGGGKLAGLTRRRNTEADLFLKGAEGASAEAGSLAAGGIQGYHTKAGDPKIGGWTGNPSAWIPGSKTRGGINFDKMADGKNYRSAQPPGDVNFFNAMKKKYGIRTLITLNSAKAGGAIAAAKKAGLNTIYMNMTSNWRMTRNQWNRIKSALQAGGALIHCTHGADRTGAAIGRYYVEVLGWSWKKAYNNVRNYGGPKDDYPKLKRFIQHGFGGLSEAITTDSDHSVVKQQKITGSSGQESGIAGDVTPASSTGKVALIGDSQMAAGIGKALRQMFPGSGYVSKTGKQPSAFVGDGSTLSALSGASKVILTLGGNGISGAERLMYQIRKAAPSAKIIWIGAPPATIPTGGSNSMVSTDPSSKKFWKTKSQKRGNNNRRLRMSIEGMGGIFIDPYMHGPFQSSKDGIHVSSSAGSKFVNKIRNKLV